MNGQVRPESQEEQKSKGPEAQETSLGASPKEVETGRLSAAIGTAGVPEIGQMPLNFQEAYNGLTRHNGKPPQWNGRGFGYGDYRKNPQLRWKTNCPDHEDQTPSLSLSFDLVTGWAFLKCHVCSPKGQKEKNAWIKRVCKKLGLKYENSLAPVIGWGAIRPKFEELKATEATEAPEAVEARTSLYSRVYGYISWHTGLTTKHKADLLRRVPEGVRGHWAERIWELGYCSVELVHHPTWGGIEKGQFHMPGISPDTLGGPVPEPGKDREPGTFVPGFYWKAHRKKRLVDYGKWQEWDTPPRFLHFCPNTHGAGVVGHGLFCPVRDAIGRILGAQVRRYESWGDKYIWLKGGGSRLHIPLGFRPGKRICVTEGVLKADIATFLGWPCIGVPGVNSFRKALSQLALWGPEEVVIAYDADQWIEGRPGEWIERFTTALISEGYKVMGATWAPEYGKGLDDMLCANHWPELIPLTDRTIDLGAEKRMRLPYSLPRL